MVLGIIDSLEQLGENVKEFLINSEHNPVVWIGLFVLGILIFFYTYNALHKQ